MRKVTVFNSVSLDGYFTDSKEDMSWAHEGADEEFAAFTHENAEKDADLLFGRVTYDLMNRYWPTAQAMKDLPFVAERMNRLRKYVFSRTLKGATWSNTTVLAGDVSDTVRALKSEAGNDLVIMGSGTIVAELAKAGLVDEYQIIVKPIALGAGKTLFNGVPDRLRLELAATRAFKNGSVLLRYEPVA